MNQTKEQIAAAVEEMRAWEYTVWMTRNAAKTNNEWSEYHPKHLRQQIANSRALLKAAGCD